MADMPPWTISKPTPRVDAVPSTAETAAESLSETMISRPSVRARMRATSSAFGRSLSAVATKDAASAEWAGREKRS